MVETQINLSEQEIGIILDVLKQEQHELPVEVHHTHSSDYRGELRDRQKLVSALIRRLEQRAVAPAV